MPMHPPEQVPGDRSAGRAAGSGPGPDDAFTQWQAAHPLPAGGEEGDARLRPEAIRADALAEGPGFAPDFGLDPGEQALGIDRKIPRRLHLWFAAALGAISVIALIGQGMLSRWSQPAGLHPVAGSNPAADPEPPLAGLQRELVRQKQANVAAQGNAGPAQGTKLPAASAAALAPAAASALPVPAGAAALDGDLPPELLDPALPGSRAVAASGPAGPILPGYDLVRSQALAAGSRILALNHGPADGMPSLDSGTGRGADRIRQFADLLHAAPELLHAIPEVMAAGHASGALAGPAAATSNDGSAAPSAASSAAAVTQHNPPGVLQAGPVPQVPLVQEGTPIPCVLLTELRSDLPGMIVAQVAEDVYDSVTAARRLIPRGTRLLGRYESQVANGQQRLFASFHRLILPGGASVDLQRMEAADRAGGAGLYDEVDTHFWARFGQAFLTAGLARAAQHGSPTSLTTAGGVIPGPDATGQILVDTARNSLQAGASLGPTLVIRRGTEFNVMVNRDLALPEVLP